MAIRILRCAGYQVPHMHQSLWKKPRKGRRGRVRESNDDLGQQFRIIIKENQHDKFVQYSRP
jgi:hypothetical protein